MKNLHEFCQKLSQKTMKKHQTSSQQNLTRERNSLLSRLYNHPTSFVVFLVVAYIILLIVSYTLGYQRGSSFSRDVSSFLITKRASNSRFANVGSSELLLWDQLAVRCANPVPPELVRQTVIELIYNGTSPYEGLSESSFGSHFQPKRTEGSSTSSYLTIYRNLVHKVRPTTIIIFNAFQHTEALYVTNFTRQLGLKTQILSFDDFHGWPKRLNLNKDIAISNDDSILLNQFLQNVIFQNATKSIMPISLSATKALEKLCKWGIFADLITVNLGNDFHSAWADINKAYKLLRPGGVLFGTNHFTSYNRGAGKAFKLFSQINKFQVKVVGHHWMMYSAQAGFDSRDVMKSR